MYRATLYSACIKTEQIFRLTRGLYLISLPRSKDVDFFESPMILNRPIRLGFLFPPFPLSSVSFPEDENTGSENKSSSLNFPPRPNFLAPPPAPLPPPPSGICGSVNKSSSRGESSVCLLEGRGEGDRERASRLVDDDGEWNSRRGPV